MNQQPPEEQTIRFLQEVKGKEFKIKPGITKRVSRKQAKACIEAKIAELVEDEPATADADLTPHQLPGGDIETVDEVTDAEVR